MSSMAETGFSPCSGGKAIARRSVVAHLVATILSGDCKQSPAGSRAVIEMIGRLAEHGQYVADPQVLQRSPIVPQEIARDEPRIGKIWSGQSACPWRNR